MFLRPEKREVLKHQKFQLSFTVVTVQGYMNRFQTPHCFAFKIDLLCSEYQESKRCYSFLVIPVRLHFCIMILVFCNVEIHERLARLTLGWIPVLSFETPERPWFKSDPAASTIVSSLSFSLMHILSIQVYRISRRMAILTASLSTCGFGWLSPFLSWLSLSARESPNT